ncbi:hypothetical protein Sango_0511200 [Sesamum angolense]|uniref:Uncharacterized protein n=1 Tax=Sesamum angolense TaxID=2727404 RepID=A0AAE2C0Z2_9LAMI|nr:hypothetical protein Sango_0511200 [Sesamum angolense]
MGRDLEVSRSPSYRRRHSPSPAPVRNRRRSRRDRSRSPYSHSRRRSRSLSSRHHRSRSPILRHHRSRSPTPKRNKRQRKRSTSSSPSSASPYVRADTKETKDASNNLRKRREERKRRQQEAELKLIEEETARRVAEAIQKKVQEGLNSEEIKLEIDKRLKEGRKKLVAEVAAQLEKEKEAALVEANRKEASICFLFWVFLLIIESSQQSKCMLKVVQEQAQRGKEELERRLEENRELEELQRQKEEALRRKKQQEEEERANQMKLLGKNKSRPKLSFSLGFDRLVPRCDAKCDCHHNLSMSMDRVLGLYPQNIQYRLVVSDPYQTLVVIRHVAGSGLRLISTMYHYPSHDLTSWIVRYVTLLEDVCWK